MSTSISDSANHPTGPGPKNQPNADVEHNVDDPLTPVPTPSPDDPSHPDSRSPAEKAYDDYGPPEPGVDEDRISPP